MFKPFKTACDTLGHNFETKYCTFGNHHDLLVFKRCVTCNEKLAYISTIHDIENVNSDWAEKYFLSLAKNKEVFVHPAL